MVRHNSRLVAALSLCILLTLAPAVRAADETKGLYQKVLRATCWVKVPGVGTGSGWVVDLERKLVVTNHHVVENEDKVTIIFPVFKNGKLVVEKTAYADERGVRGKVLDTDVARDLAVIQIIDPLPEGTGELKLAADSAEPSDRVHSIGNPGASDGLWVYTSGTVRQVYKWDWHHLDLAKKTKTFRKAKVLQTQAPINSGDSGGPVVDDKGHLVAVTSSSTMRHNDQPVQLISTGIDVTEVKEFVQQTVRLMDPKTAADFVLRGERLSERGKYSDAISDFSAAIKLDRNHAPAYRKRGWAFGCKGDHDTTIADCNEAVRIDPDDAFSYENRGWAWEKKGDLDKAVADYTKAIQLDVKFSRAYNNRGIVYFKRKDLTRALADFSRAIEADPKNAVAWANRGDTHHDLKDFDKAIADCTTALNMNPFLTYAWNARGWAYRDKGMQDAHIKNFEIALEYDPKNPSLWVSLGNAVTFKDQWKQAVAIYSKALELNKNQNDAYFFRGSALEELGRLGDAQNDYEKAIELNPKWKDRVKKQNRCFLKVTNQTAETIRVYVMYEYLSDKGEWVWHPQDATKTFWKVEPGKTTLLLDDNWKIECRRCRIWAVGETSGTTWNKYREADWWLCPKDGYLAKNKASITQTFSK
ncbi:MAG: serine protease [Gemmataceae bacterium]|nr:serine protease [Gemmataceae bacterium]